MIYLTEVVGNVFLLFTRAMRLPAAIRPDVDPDTDLIRFRKEQSDKK